MKRAAIVAVFLGSLAVASRGTAQSLPDETPSAPAPDSARGPGIEEIVVTAERKEGTVQGTPVALSAFTEADIEAGNYLDFEDISLTVPNVQFGRTLVGGGGVTIRGVSSGTGDRATAFHVDGIYQNRPTAAEAFSFFDVRRVEVLRGPQGTLYGRNATGGSINIISNPPTDQLELFGDVQVGTYDQVLTRAAFNLPLYEDRVMSRVSFYGEWRDGYQRNGFTAVRRDDADDARELAVRNQFRFVPVDDMELTLRYIYAQTRGVGNAQKVLGELPDSVDLGPFVVDFYHNASPNPKDDRRINLDYIGASDTTIHTPNAQFTWDLYDLPLIGHAQLTALGSYYTSDFFGRSDQDGTDADVVRVYNTVRDCEPDLIQDLGAEGAGCTKGDTDTTEWVGELQFASVGGENLDWVVGLFYLNYELDQDILAVTRPLQFVLQPPLGDALAGTVTPVATFSNNRDQSAAGFGQASYTAWDDWTFTLGVRYTHDWKKLESFSPQVLIGGIIQVTPEIDVDDKDDWDAVTGEARVEWRWHDDNMVYAKGSRGYKAGEIESAVNDQGDKLDNADPEYIWAFEFGSKNRLFDDRLQANLTSFYYAYKDLQVSTLVELVVATQNAAEATIWGFEAEFVALPLLDWDLDLQLIANFGYLHARYDEFDCFFPEDATLTRRDCSGNTLPRAPPYTITFIADWPLDLGRLGTLTPRAQFYASGKVFFRPFNCPNSTCDELGITQSDKQSPYQLTDFLLTWSARERKFWVQGFVNNVFDEDVIQSQVTSTRLIGSVVQTRFDRPRVAGVRLGFSW